MISNDIDLKQDDIGPNEISCCINDIDKIDLTWDDIRKKWNKYHNDEIDPDRSKKRWYQKNQARIEWTIMRWSDLTCYDIVATGGGRAAGETRGWGVSPSALTTSTPSPRHKCDILSNPRSWNNIPMSVWIFDHGTPSLPPLRRPLVPGIDGTLCRVHGRKKTPINACSNFYRQASPPPSSSSAHGWQKCDIFPSPRSQKYIAH